MSEVPVLIEQWTDPLVEKAVIVTRTDGDKFVNIELSKEANGWSVLFFSYEIKYLLDNIDSVEIDVGEIDDGDVLECRAINEGQGIAITLSHRAKRQVLTLSKAELQLLLTKTM
jgi:hypothetical protein